MCSIRAPFANLLIENRPSRTSPAHAVARLFFLADEVKVRADTQKIDQYRDRVPCDYGPRSYQQTVVDPQDLKDAHDGGHPRVNASAGATPEHGDQVGHSGEGRSKARQKAKDF